MTRQAYITYLISITEQMKCEQMEAGLHALLEVFYLFICTS